MAKQVIVDVDANTKPFLDKMSEATGKLSAFADDSIAMGDNISKLGAGMAAGFAIATGAVGAFGDAMGFSAEEIANAQSKATSFISIMTSVKPLMEGAAAGMKLLNLAMAANPIGVLIVAITALVAAIIYFAQEEDKAAAATQRLNDQLQAQADYTTDLETIYLRLTKQQIELAKLSGASTKEIAELEATRNKQLLKYAQEEESILKQQLQNLDELIFRGKELTEDQEAAYAALPKQIKDASTKIKVIRGEIELDVLRIANAEKDQIKENVDKYTDAQTKKADVAKKFAEDRINAARQIKDMEISLIEDETERSIAALNEQYARLIEDTKNSETLLQEEKTAIVKTAELNRIAGVKVITDEAARVTAEEDAFKYEEAEALRVSLIADKYERDRVLQQQEFDSQVEQLDTFLADKTISEEDYNAQLLAAKQQLASDIGVIDQAEFDFRDQLRKVDAANITSTAKNTLNLIGNLAGQGSALGKAAAVAQTTIDTYKAAQGAYASLSGIPIVGPALGAVAAGVAVAAGIANVKKILAVKLPGKVTGGNGGGAAAAPSIPKVNFVDSNAPKVIENKPSFNLFGRGNENGLSTGESQNANGGSQLIKAFVSETDLVRTNNRLSTIRNASEL